jgi:hypothetical protein
VWPDRRPGRSEDHARAHILAVLNSQSSGSRWCVNHSFIASVQASQWGGVAYSPAIRPRPLGPRQGGAFSVAGATGRAFLGPADMTRWEDLSNNEKTALRQLAKGEAYGCFDANDPPPGCARPC